MRPSKLLNTVELHDAGLRRIQHFPYLGVLNMRVELSRYMQSDYLPDEPDEPVRGWLHFTQVEGFDSNPPFASIDWSSMSGEILGIYPMPERDRDNLQAFKFLTNIYKDGDRTRPLYVMHFLCSDALWLPDSNDPGSASLLQVLNTYLRHRESGLLTRDNLAFTPAAALSLLHDMAEIGVRGLGIAGWYFYTPDPPQWIEHLGIDVNPFPAGVMLDKGVENTTGIVADFLQSELPANAAYIFLYFSYPAAWNKIISTIWKLIPGPTYPPDGDTSAPGDTRRFAQVLIAYLQYFDQAILVDNDLLFESGAVRPLVAEMARLGVACSGAAGWSVSPSDGTFIQDGKVDFSIHSAADGVQQSADAVSQFLARLPEQEMRVSIQFDLPDAWSAVIRQVWQQIHGNSG